ncbi:MAG: hypothetical protein QF384_00120 [Alphaproteobacteria bacterium]|jgi:hypothetical protein|nr:hypothetical protein [Alphaproteobacteria bacterium]
MTNLGPNFTASTAKISIWLRKCYVAAAAFAAAVSSPALGLGLVFGPDEIPRTPDWGASPFLSDGPLGSPRLVFDSVGKPWLPAVIAKMKKRESAWTKFLGVEVFENGTGETYLFISWHRRDDITWWDYEVVYAVSINTNGEAELRHLRDISTLPSDGTVAMYTKSGYPLAKGEAPVLALQIKTRGSDPDTANLHFYLMKGDTIEITPSWAGKRWLPEDYDADGRLELPVNLDHYQYYAPESENDEWQEAPAVLIWRGENFRPACKTHKAAFNGFLQWNEEQIETYPADPNWHDKPLNEWDTMGRRMEHMANLALTHAQIGDHDTAWKYGLKFAQGYKMPEHEILSVLKKAKALDDLQCPASAALSDDPRWRLGGQVSADRNYEPSWAGKAGWLRDSDKDGAIDAPISLIDEYDLEDGCGWPRNSLPAMLTWKNDGFVPACKSLHANFKWEFDWLNGYLKRYPSADVFRKLCPFIETPARAWLKTIARLAYTQAQIGAHDKANEVAKRYMRENSRINPGSPQPSLIGDLENAKALDHLQCPASAVLYNDPRWRLQ